MPDRLIKFALTWGLCGVCLVAFGLAAALYFAFCSISLAIIDLRVLRPGAEQKLVARGIDPVSIEVRMLRRDRGAAFVRALVGVSVAYGFHRYA